MITAADVVEVVARELGTPAEMIGVDASAADVPAWDSLGHVRVCMAIETTFDVVIDLDSMESVKSVGGIVDFVNAAHG